ncbi:MAG: type II secretion system protein [Candidatus Omnitrophica bacterium]|nr:type II secretion system protein [Candidatus Omnitrophota bacterium]
MRLRVGFTITEIMVVLIIVGIFSALTFGAFSKKVEIDKRRNAAENLKVIYNMEKRYQLDNGQFFPPKDPGDGSCSAATVADINKDLRVFIRDSYFSYSIEGECSGTKTMEYRAVATRSDGPCLGSTITLTQAGSEPVVSACAGW